MSVRLLRADAMLQGGERPLRDAAVVVDEAGTILDAGRAADLMPRHAGAIVEQVRGVLLPGLINAHTHVELSALRGKIAGGHGFVPWVERLVGTRAAEHPEEDTSQIEQAAADLAAYGTVAVGEVTNTLASVHALARHGIGGMIFHEVFGTDPTRGAERLAAMAEDFRDVEAHWPTPDLGYAPAPHTLYTTHPEVVAAVLRVARARGAPTTVHLAEHSAERTFLRYGNGPFLDFVKRVHLSIDRFPVPGQGPIDYAADLGLLSPDVLLVHLTDIRASELERVASSGAPVVLCPRSNLYIEVKLPPLFEMVKAGIFPALGTDSLASSPSLDVLGEARALADRFPSIPKGALVDMATVGGARALGRADLGRLAKGCRPGVLAVIGELAPDADPAAWVLAQPPASRKWLARRTRPTGPEGPTGKELPG
jgi:cytosine/adenosine deaminase-related metal-dependent hydrolase